MLRRLALIVSLLLGVNLLAQTPWGPASPISKPIPGRLIVLYRNHIVPSNADEIAALAGARAAHHLRKLGLSTLRVAPPEDSAAVARLAANPQVALILHDRYVTAQALLLNRIPPGGSYPEGATVSAAGQASAGASGWIVGACSSGLTNTTDGLPADGGSFGCFNLGHAQYVQAMGTSASAALAAGAAAILRAARPDLTPEQIVSTLLSTATQLSSMQEPELKLAAAIAQP